MSQTDRSTHVSRRDFLRAGGLLVAGAAAGACTPSARTPTSATPPHTPHALATTPGALPGTVGEVDHEANGFDPTDVLTDFDYGSVTTQPDGRRIREWEIVSYNKDIEVVPGISFPAWTFNGRIPGPTLRCTEGDRLRIVFRNGSDHPHTMHFHGFHPADMDGVPPSGLVEPGGQFIYEFDASPFGLHLYHCHAFPLARHIAKGLYGAFIVDPKDGRPPVDREMIMVMNGLDVDFDDANDFYAVNGIPFHYQNHPIQIGVGERIRVYLVNILEYDLINSFHLHANFFQYYPTGTSLTPAEFTDTIIQGQAQRGILEFKYDYPGMYMFHAHVTEFAELGWNGMFEVLPRLAGDA
jgi:FtsP/CotA-like multicopper oxidase with cupredoxin domain